MERKILLTGGGTAGHVTPNLAMINKLRSEGFQIEYAGSHDGIEKELVEKAGLPYHGVSSGKLRRYLSLKNVTDIFRVMKGICDAKRILKKVKPSVVFSKGGFVAVPIVMAARNLKIPVVIHESDITPGLANRLSIPFADFVCATFPETIKYLPERKSRLTGTPIREYLLRGSRREGLSICGFREDVPTVLVMGGSQGSVAINNCLRSALDSITETFQVIHICGKGNLDETIQNARYKQFEYVSKGLPHLFAASDIIVSRAGSNSIFEFVAVKKPSLLIPLSRKASRGDQILNAISFEKQGFAKVLQENELNEDSLEQEIKALYDERKEYIKNLKAFATNDSICEIVDIINKMAKA